jgi:acyl-CoA reductase-like NAD-dependent aldehyde dehydrogenase
MQIKDNPSGARYGKTLVGDHIIGGELLSPSSEERFQSRNPAFQPDIVGDFPMGSAATVEAACKAAGKAFQTWKYTPAPVRGQIIGRVTQILIEKKEMLSRLLTREIGKPLRESRGEVQEAIDTCRLLPERGASPLYGQTVPSELRNKELETFRRPLGVCAMITAGNFPFAVPGLEDHPRD